MKKHRRIIAACAVSGALLLGGATSLRAEPNVLIHPGIPDVHPGETLVVASANPLIPTGYPIIQAKAPTVQPGFDLTRPVHVPLIHNAKR